MSLPRSSRSKDGRADSHNNQSRCPFQRQRPRPAARHSAPPHPASRADSHISAKVDFTQARMRARAVSRCIQSPRRPLSFDAHHQFVRNRPQDRCTPITCLALSFSARAPTERDGRFLRALVCFAPEYSWQAGSSSSMTSAEARICSYECTFRADCAEAKLHNVCPNCGGGFVPRPVGLRPNGVERFSQKGAHRQLSIHLSYSSCIARHTARTFPSEQR